MADAWKRRNEREETKKKKKTSKKIMRRWNYVRAIFIVSLISTAVETRSGAATNRHESALCYI